VPVVPAGTAYYTTASTGGGRICITMIFTYVQHVKLKSQV